VKARSIIPLSGEQVISAIERKAEVLLAFDGGDAERPIILGWIQPEVPRACPPPVRVDAMVDGRRVVVSAEDEIVLSCGKASITLRRNGRVIIHGAYVETKADGINRIKGGSVKVN